MLYVHKLNQVHRQVTGARGAAIIKHHAKVGSGPKKIEAKPFGLNLNCYWERMIHEALVNVEIVQHCAYLLPKDWHVVE